MRWSKRGSATNLIEVITTNSGMTEDELLNPTYADPRGIENLQLAAHIILYAAQNGVPICVLGDYDVDGITSTSILCRLFSHLGIKVSHRLPMRFSEGYGLSIAAIDEIKDPKTIIVTVDNGIAAVDEIAYAKKKGYLVVVIDHHLPGTSLPAADVLVDPHVNPKNNVYEHYCGAGLALKLAELILSDNAFAPYMNTADSKRLLDKLTLLAAIGTVADVMPLSGDNRRIVKRGLSLLQEVEVAGVTGVRAIIEAAEVYSRTEHEIGFKIAPILNAPGRLHDDGAELSYQLLMMDVTHPGSLSAANEAAKALILINEERKEAVERAMDEAMESIADECLFGAFPLCICLQDANEGVVGIVAGRLAERMQTPTFVFTSTETPGVLKGSGRSAGGINLKEMVDYAVDFLVQAGGHKGAAGVVVETAKFCDMVETMSKYAVSLKHTASEVQYYDITITPDEVAGAYAQLKKYAPYGEGNPKPVFFIENIGLVPRMGNRYKTMGKDGSHLKLFGNGYSILAFGGTEEYRRLGMPNRINAIGTISENKFRNTKELQFETIEFAAAPVEKGGSTLLEALKANGTI